MSLLLTFNIFAPCSSVSIVNFEQINAGGKPFHATDDFLYYPKATEKQTFPDVFRVCRKRTVAWNRLANFAMWSALIGWTLSASGAMAAFMLPYITSILKIDTARVSNSIRSILVLYFLEYLECQSVTYSLFLFISSMLIHTAFTSISAHWRLYGSALKNYSHGMSLPLLK